MTPRWAPRPLAGAPEGLILFDGVCVLCSWWVRFVIERDPPGRFSFVPIQSPYGRRLAGLLGIDADAPQTNAVLLRGRAFFKSDAALQVLGRLPGWGWVALLRPLPRGLRDWLYDRVAGNRYRLFGRTDSCMMPTPDITRRFPVDGGP